MKLSYEQVRTIASNIRNSANTMNSLLNDSKKEMQKVNTDGVWKSGSAQKAYQTFEELSGTFPAFYDKVIAYADFLEKTVSVYEQADAAIANKIG